MYACSRRVKTLSEAIVMLGFNSIRSLVVTSAARNLYNTRKSRTGLKERLLWEHSIGCAFACRLLAAERMPGLAEEAFLAGLMHDIGKLVLNLQVPEKFDEVVQIVYNENRPVPRDRSASCSASTTPRSARCWSTSGSSRRCSRRPS